MSATGLPKAAGGFTAGSLFSTALNSYFAYSDYKDVRAEGGGFLEAAGTAALNFAIPELVGMAPYLLYQAGSALAQGGVAAYENGSMKLRQMDRDNKRQIPFQNYTFVDSPQIYTMRQAGLALAQQSKYNLQQTMMGNEARYMHR